MSFYSYTNKNVHKNNLTLFPSQVQTHDIAQKKDIVLNDLSKVEPAVKEAQQGKQWVWLLGWGLVPYDEEIMTVFIIMMMRPIQF